jgi:hypothetical protein
MFSWPLDMHVHQRIQPWNDDEAAPWLTCCDCRYCNLGSSTRIVQSYVSHQVNGIRDPDVAPRRIRWWTRSVSGQLNIGNPHT